MTATQLILILRGRKALIWKVFFSIVLFVLVVSLIWPNTYVAEASVVLNSITTDPVSGIEQPSELLPNNLATQLDVIASHNVALKVVDKLNLTANPELHEKYMKATEGLAPVRDWIADRLIDKNLTVVPPKEGNVIQIDLSAHDAKFAAQLANAFAEAYIETHLEIKLEPERRQSTWFVDQVQELRKAINAAQKRLTDYQRDHNVVGTNARMDVENTRLGEISDQLIVAQSDMYGAQTKLKQMNAALQQDKLEELPDIQGDPLLQSMKANLVIAEGRLAQISSSFGNNHPDFISAEAQVKELRAKLIAQLSLAKGSISQTAEISSRKEAELSRALGQQRDRVLALKREQDELDALKQEVTDAQTAYDAAMQRSTQVHLESRLDQSNLAILNPAIPPMKIARPKILLNVALAVILGLMFGIAAAVAKEIRDPRVRSRSDVWSTADLEVLGQIPRAPARKLGVFRRAVRKKRVPAIKVWHEAQV